jgi:hypothetical protein
MHDRTGASEDSPEPRDGGFRENPAPQGFKKPPFIPPGEESGEWTRGRGTDPNEVRKKDDRGP